MKGSFRTYIFVTLILLSILLMLLVNVAVYIISKKQMEEEKLKDYELTIKTVFYYLNRILEEKSSDLNIIAFYLRSSESEEKKKQQVTAFLSLKPDIKYILILDKKGIVKDIIPYNDDIIGIDLSNDPAFKTSNQYEIYGPHISIMDKKPYYIISKSLPDKDIFALITIPGINSMIETLKRQGYYAFIVNNEGLTIAHVNQEIVEQGTNLSHYNFVRKGISGKEEIIEAEIEGKKYIFTAKNFLETNFIFFIGNEYKEAFSNFYKLRTNIIYIFIFSIFLSFFISLIISVKFSKPVHGFMKIIENIKKGIYKFSPLKTEVKEFETISEGLSDMAKIISKRETELRKIFESSADCIAIVTKDGDILDINEAGVKMFGYDDKSEMLKIKTLDTYADISDRIKYLKELEEKGYVKNYEVPLRKKNGEIFYALISSSLVKNENGKILFIVTTIKDITEKRKLQEQLFQTQKMESIGRLAGSIAHDFNNVLSIIYGNTQLLQMYSKDNPQFTKYTSSISNAVEKAKDFIKKLLAFSKRQPLIFKTYDINELIKEEIKILKPTIREDIKLELVTSDFPLFVNLDRSQFTQIILNLTVNAMDAMPNGGIINISVEPKTIDEDYLKAFPLATAGNYVCINFSDTGTGIPKDIIDKIFEPFFTTKHEGTGLGLSTVYNIIQQHNGFINVYSEEGAGTTFKIYLPLTKEKEEKKIEKEIEIEIGIKNILLVEDNDEVRAVVEEILRNNNFEVFSYSSGLDVLEQFEKLKDKIELCLFDVVMPAIGGFELYKKIKEIKPDIKVLFMTGYANNLLQVSSLIKEGAEIINKPFSIDELKKKIKKIL